ncbi:MAG: hypothetical protein V4538_02370 [Bacteroidota bacterium]
MKVEIETGKSLGVLAEIKQKKLQTISDVMDDNVLELFAGIASKADTPEKVKDFNAKVMDSKALIEGAFGGEGFSLKKMIGF